MDINIFYPFYFDMWGKKNCLKSKTGQLEKKKKANTYYSLNIKNGGALIDMALGRNRTSWEFHSKRLLKLTHVVLHIAVHGCHLHQLGSIYLAKPLDVYRPSLFVYTMVALWVVL